MMPAGKKTQNEEGLREFFEVLASHVGDRMILGLLAIVAVRAPNDRDFRVELIGSSQMDPIDRLQLLGQSIAAVIRESQKELRQPLILEHAIMKHGDDILKARARRLFEESMELPCTPHGIFVPEPDPPPDLAT